MQEIIIAFNSKFKDLQNNRIIPADIKPAYDGESSCIDLYTTDKIEISSFQSQYNSDWYKTLIPTGMYIKLKNNQTALILERGSVFKTRLKVRAGVIDPGYHGEIFVNAVNLDTTPITFSVGEKLPFQLLVIEHSNLYKEISLEDYLLDTKESKRQEGKLGSSNG